MATQGPLSPSVAANDSAVGTKAWNSVDDIKVSDNNRAFCGASFAAPLLTNYLKATSFGFSIPTGATIDGIVVEIEKAERSDTGGAVIRDNAVRIVKSDGSIGTTNKADTVTNWSTTESYISYGGATDVWGETWSAEDINDTDFGVVLAADIVSGDFTNAGVDHIRITVYYTGGASASFSPSISPSISPSQSPSASLSPSISPSVSPSQSPSASFSPSISPSASPSQSPSASFSPSLSPSISPSESPSASLSPSISPSISPSASPSSSLSPSVSPSISPSQSPSASFSPSISPSVSPSQSPSASISPSASPSAIESASLSPSLSPSISPSVSPSASLSPSASPSASLSPSVSPSISPSVSPSTAEPWQIFPTYYWDGSTWVEIDVEG